MAVLGDYHSRMVPAIQANGGSVDKYLGDGILVSFGAARPSQTYAADALGALGDVLATADAWNADRAARGEEPLGIGVAVAVGPVLFGVTGDASRLEFTVIGDVVNLAAKLEKHCKAVQRPALATADTLTLARAQGFGGGAAFTRLDGERVSGVGAPVDLVALG
jgi:adenylate cyclase